MRKTVDIFGVSLPIAIISAIMLLFAYLGYITPFILLLVVGAIYKISDEVLARNTMKISLLYVFHLIFGVAIDLISRFFLGFFEWINELVEYNEFLTKINGWMRDFFDFTAYAENVLFFVLLIIGAASLLKSDYLKLPIADGVFNKILNKKNPPQNYNPNFNNQAYNQNYNPNFNNQAYNQNFNNQNYNNQNYNQNMNNQNQQF